MSFGDNLRVSDLENNSRGMQRYKLNWDLTPSPETKRRSAQMLAGACAGVITKTSVAPIERIKIWQQTHSMVGTSEGIPVLRVARNILQADGIIGYFKGNGANCVRVIPVYALKFCFNDKFRDMIKRTDQTVRDMTFLQLMTAGTTAGMTQLIITYPLELVRVRLTISERFGVKYNGIFDCAINTVRKEGYSGLYKGLGMTMLSGSPYVGMQMTFFELFSRYNQDSALWKLLAGAFAGLLSQTITFPGDTVRRKMGMNGVNGTERQFKNSWDCIKKIVKKEGYIGFYRGAQTNMIRCLPGAAIQFNAYEFFKKSFGAGSDK